MSSESTALLVAGDDDIVERLASSDWKVRQSAIKALFKRPDAKYVGPMLEQLRSAVPGLRHDASVALVNLAVRLPPAALASHSAALAEKLWHTDSIVSQSCAHALFLVDPAHGASLLRTISGNTGGREAQARRALEIASESDLIQPNKSLSARELFIECGIVCVFLLAAFAWLSRGWDDALSWRYGPSYALLFLAVVRFVTLALVSRYRKAKVLSSSPLVSVRMEPLRFSSGGALQLPPSQIVRSLIEPGVALAHRDLFASHLPYQASAKEKAQRGSLFAIERVAHAWADRFFRSYRFDQPILSCVTPHPSPLFAVPSVHWAAPGTCPTALYRERFSKLHRRRWADLVFISAGAVPIGLQRLEEYDTSYSPEVNPRIYARLAREAHIHDPRHTTIELNPTGDYMIDNTQAREADLILLGHPSNLDIERFRCPEKLEDRDPPEEEPPIATILVVIGSISSSFSNVGEGWRVGDEQNPLSQLVHFLDASVAQGSRLTILAPPHLTDRINTGLKIPKGGRLPHLASAEARPMTPGSLLASQQHGGREDEEEGEGGSRAEVSAATHVLLLEVEEAEEAAVLAAAAPGARVAACRGGRFYLSEGEDGDSAALVDYTLPHPRIFGPEAEEKLLGLLAHVFACNPPRASGGEEASSSQEEPFAVNLDGEIPPESIHIKPATYFASPGEELTFVDLQARARMQALSAIGYIAAARRGEIVWPHLERDYNGPPEPLLTRKREWSAGDRVVVIETNYPDE